MRPEITDRLEVNACYVLGVGYVGIVLTKEPTNYQTYSYVLSELIKNVRSRFKSSKIVVLNDNLSSHIKAESWITKKSKKPNICYNLPHLPQLNSIENSFASVKLRYYYDGF